MFYFLRQNLFEFADIIDISGHTEETGKHLWTEGVRFTENIPLQTLTLDPSYGTVMPDFFDTTVPVMTDRLLKALNEAGVDNYDAYPVVLHRPDTGEQWDNYKAVNFIGSIDAIDRDNSDCEDTAIGSLECESITIDESIVGNIKCFRLSEGPDLLVINQEVADSLENNEFVAVMIQNTEDYDGD